MHDLFQKAIDYYNSGYYFEAHDTFEELWMDEREENKLFYQGLVQLATGYYHFVMKNPKGTISQLNKSIEKLASYAPEHERVDVAGLIRQVRAFLQALQNAPPERVPYADLLPKIPKLKRGVYSNE